MEGAIVAKIPHRLDQNATIELIVHEPTIIYILHGKPRSGGLETSLPLDGWTLLDDDTTLSSQLPNTFVWEKKVTTSGTTKLTLPARTKETVCSILFKGNTI